ncbi:DMT family transporter [Dongia sedimenti]|uniref:DMT family transporter n=1 Tax=Dongia sedimenti TaxID=3064282 RepID=A0ABU0YI98_9PROT|nr:DMT family transporter [Rhodospirillaceae bacterium R-7]
MGRWAGTAVLLLLAVLWGTMVPTIAHLLKTWDPLFLATLRYLGGGPALLPALLLIGRDGGRAVPFWRVALLGAVGIGGYAGLFTFGVAHANPVTAAIITAAGPAVATATDRLIFGRPINPHMLPGLILAICGCVTATIDFTRAGSPFDLRGGEILILAAITCWSWYSSAAQRWLKGWSQLRISCVTMTTGGVTLTIVYLIAAALGGVPFPPPVPSSAEDTLVLLWLVLVLVAIGVLLWNFGVQRSGVVTASLYLNLTPIIAVLILSLGGTLPNLQQVIGGGMVILGILWAELATMRNASPPPAGIDEAPGL